MNVRLPAHTVDDELILHVNKYWYTIIVPFRTNRWMLGLGPGCTHSQKPVDLPLYGAVASDVYKLYRRGNQACGLQCGLHHFPLAPKLSLIASLLSENTTRPSSILKNPPCSTCLGWLLRRSMARKLSDVRQLRAQVQEAFHLWCIIY